MSLELTVEQKEKLRKLDEEMKHRKENAEKNRLRREASSQTTGIPMNIVDMDVIKIGTMLGLIKKKSILEGREPDTDSSLLTILFGCKDEDIDISKIPQGFKNAPNIFTEVDKINHHQQYVQKQCEHLSDITMSMITQEMSNITSCFSFNIESATLDNFKTACIDIIDVILDELCDDDDDDKLWQSLRITRNALLGVVDICEYKKILNDHILTLKKAGKSYSRILKHLSVNDVRLTLCRGCLTQTNGPLTLEDSNRLIREIEIRSYMKPPELKPFNFDDIVRQCCIPSLLCIPINIVIEHGLIGPYQNNSIGYLSISAKDLMPWSFYNLKSINNDGTRLWVLDNKLWMLTDNMISSLTSYMIKIFKIFYYEYYRTNSFKQGFWEASKNKHYDAFMNMMYNITFISNQSMFHRFLMIVIRKQSSLIPTEYDFFNHLMYYDFPITYTPYITCFEDNMKQMFHDLSGDDLKKLKMMFVNRN